MNTVNRTVNPSAGIFAETRKVIERGWARGAYARDVNGRMVAPSEDNAVCFCLSGALIAVIGVTFTPVRVQDRFREIIGFGTIDFNDSPGRTKDQILEALDKCIAAGDIPISEAL